MPSPAYDQLLAVQDLDTALAQLRHRLATHPLRQEQAAIAAQQAAAQARHDEIAGRRHEVERELKRLADEVALVEDKRARTEGKLYDRSVTATKELLALQEESASLLERQRRIEDDELELMEQMEGIDNELAEAAGELGRIQASAADTSAALAAAVAEIEGEIARTAEQRATAAAAVAPDLLATYESLAPDFDGAPLARFVGGRCDGCHMQLAAVAVDRINKTPPDQVVTCEECGRLLIR